MNYRHIYHAGCYADVFKHIILTELLQKLRSKEKPFCVIDTHAGLGIYDIQSVEAQKTLEFEKGILKFLTQGGKDSDFEDYVRTINVVNKEVIEKNETALKKYPGSPFIARFYLREQDRLKLCEWHPEDVKVLQKHFEKDQHVKVFHQDAYQFLKAILPPLEKRGLILIDPPFEKTNEFQHLMEGLHQAFKRFAHGIYAIWYPIKDFKTIEQFHFDLKKTGFVNSLCLEMTLDVLPPDESLRGCGMTILNPPWQFKEKMKILLPKLIDYLDFKGKITIES